VVTQAGQPAFAGSVAPAPTGSFGSTPGTATGTPAAGAGRSSAPSEQAATGDVWSGFSAGQTPSLTSAADGVPEDGTGSELGWGLGLLALGLLALVAGLTAAEVRRRRTA
jgi:hypothetical protein